MKPTGYMDRQQMLPIPKPPCDKADGPIIRGISIWKYQEKGPVIPARAYRTELGYS